jgi:hypothetical protein
MLFGSPEGKKRELTDRTEQTMLAGPHRAPGPPSEEPNNGSDRKCKQTIFAGA